MNDPKDDGGPAFPSTDYFNEKPVGSHGGISTRDYFAAKALVMAATLVAAHGTPLQQSAEQIAPTIAAMSYLLADAMLEWRKKS